MVKYAPRIVRERWHQIYRVFSEARCEAGALYALKVLCGAWVAVVAMLPKMFAERTKVQAIRSISEAELDSILED
jgi:hypothetical protein